MFEGAPGITSVRIHIDEKDCVVIEHIVHYLSLAVQIYPDLAVRFFIVFFHYILLNLLLSFFPFSHSALLYYKTIIRTLIDSGARKDRSYTHPRKTPSKNCISPKNSGPNDINPNAHLPERALAGNYIPRKNFFPEFKLARVHSWPKLNFPENLFSKIYTCQISHWAEITFSENLISRIRTCQNFYIWSKLLYHENLFLKTLHISRQIETLLSRINITQNLLAHLCLHLTLKLRVE